MTRAITQVTMQDAAAATGNGTPLNVAGFGAFMAQVSGTFSGTVTWEATIDGTNWIGFYVANLNTGAQALTTTATAIVVASVAGLKAVRARISAYTSGNVTVLGTAVDGPAYLLNLVGSTTQTGGSAANTARTTATVVTPVQTVDAAGLVSGALPAAAALADAATNPTTPMIGADLLGYNGASWDRVRLPNVQKDLSTVALGSIVTVWTPTSGKKARLMGGSISLSAAASVLFEDNAGGVTVFRTPKLLADTPYNFVVNGGQGYLLAAANNVLKATSSAAANALGTLWGTEE